MKKKCILSQVLIISCLIISINLLAQEKDFMPGQILIQLKPEAIAKKTSFKNQLQAKTIKKFTENDLELWELPTQNKASTLALIEEYKNHPDVLFMEPNYVWSVDDLRPNDPDFPKLWPLHNTGQTIKQNAGTDDVDLDFPESWCMNLTVSEAVVGILDTGIDWRHEDLVEKIWQNLGEDADGDGRVLEYINGEWVFDPDDENGVDDDGNGFTDDFIGWDFVNNDNNPNDGHSHGTHCAGTIGATINNELGIAGVAGNAKLAALKFLADDGRGTTDAAIAALDYAVAMGMPISNNSWGGGSYSYALYQAIERAKNSNHLFVAAAGNNSMNNDQYAYYPSSYDHDNVISVASINNQGQLSYFSNYGATSVDIAAPGTDIYSCLPYNNYGYKSGTSMAVPHVVGVCVWLIGMNPNSDISTIKNTLMNTVNKIDDLNDKSLSDGYINLEAALLAFGAEPCESSPPPPSPPTCNRLVDSLALIDLYNATDGANWTNTWNLNLSMDNWYGVGEDNDGCVTKLSLDGNNLNGTIPPSIGNLKRLRNLNLYSNNLFGEVPAEIGNLVELEILFLSSNNLESIPTAIGNLVKLEELNFSSNGLTGIIPPEIGTLTELEYLSLHNNLLTGEIPAEIGNLTKLKQIELKDNNLSGEIPPSIGNLVLLEVLKLRHNELTGSIPIEIGNLTLLVSLSMRNNQLTGSIPPEIGNLRELTGLNLAHNMLTGEIPVEIGNLTKMDWLQLNSNQLSGEIPASIGNLVLLDFLALSDNQLTGNIPPELCNLSITNVLRAYGNQLEGCYPACLKKFCTTTYSVTFGDGLDATWSDFCATGAGSCGPVISKVWPGDFDYNGTAEINDLLYWGIAYGSTGIVRPDTGTDWTGKDCQDWTNFVNGINGKHQDGNGNGIVDIADFDVLRDNLGNTHSFTSFKNLGNSLVFNLKRNYETNGANSNPTIIEYEFYLEEESANVNAHGFSASINFGNLNVNSAYIDISNSSLQAQQYLEKFDASSNTLYFSLTKTNGVNTIIGTDDPVCRVVVEVLIGDTDMDNSIDLRVNGNKIKANGQLNSSAGSTFYETSGGIAPSQNNIVLNASASHVNCIKAGSAKVSAVGGSGNFCYEWNTGETTQEIDDLSPGFYKVKVCDDNGVEDNIEVEVLHSAVPIHDEYGNIINCDNFNPCTTILNLEEYLPNGPHRANRTILSNASLNNGGEVQLNAGERIKITSGFTTRGTTSFSANIQACE